MESLKQITDIKIEPTSKVNGKKTTYEVTIVPSTQIFSSDMLVIEFPPEISLPIKMNCSSPSTRYVFDLSCFKGNKQTVKILLIEVSSFLVSGTEFKLLIHNVTNPSSLRPTSPFGEIVFKDSR